MPLHLGELVSPEPPAELPHAVVPSQPQDTITEVCVCVGGGYRTEGKHREGDMNEKMHRGEIMRGREDEGARHEAER